MDDEDERELIPDLEEPNGGQSDHHTEDQARDSEVPNQTVRAKLASHGISSEVPAGRRLSEAIRHGLVKAHCNLGHPSKEDLARFLKLGNPTAYHPAVGDAGSDVAMRMRTARNRTRKLPVPKIGRCFLVAGEHLREAVGDEKHVGNPELQKAIALFKKVPSDATYEDLIGQQGPDGEPMDIEEQPLNREVADKVMADDDVLDT
eukprot:s4670_g12.t1